jgi:hypothetical protein
MRVRLSSHPEVWFLIPRAHFPFFAALITGLGAGVFEAFKGRPAAIAASTSALNGGMVAATFFSEPYFCLHQTTPLTVEPAPLGVREYAVSPILVSNLSWRQYETRALGLQKIVTDKPLSWSELRTYNLLDTGISGALTGGLLNTWKSTYTTQSHPIHTASNPQIYSSRRTPGPSPWLVHRCLCLHVAAMDVQRTQHSTSEIRFSKSTCPGHPSSSRIITPTSFTLSVRPYPARASQAMDP